MLTYLIDAFNVIHRVPHLRDHEKPHFNLIAYMRKNGLTGSDVNKVIVVFDGHPVDGLSDPVYQTLFSFSTTADAVIKRKLDSFTDRRSVVVVSDDRAIRDYAKKSGAQSLRTGDFLSKTKATPIDGDMKNISYTLQREITEEMRKIWDK
jgi:predicted RNA-binding protein with PIN domain